MNKINTKSVAFALGILAIFTFGLLIRPARVSADTPGYVTSYNSTRSNSVVMNDVAEANNPVPVINSINPNSGNRGTGGRTVTIIGNGFIPTSVARWNGSNRPTTFIDYSHLLTNLSPVDMYESSGRYITVFNGAPGGGYSNAAFFTINNTASTTSNTQNNNSYSSSTNSTNTVNDTNNTSSNTTQTDSTDNTSDTSNLASNVIFGSNSFLPSGLIQWILFGIVILLIVILVRKAFGAKENYDAAPMKHD